VISSDAQVRLFKLKSLLEDRACSLPPVIEIAAHEHRIASVGHLVDSVAHSPDLAPAIGLHETQVQAERMKWHFEPRDEELGMEDSAPLEGIGGDIDVLKAGDRKSTENRVSVMTERSECILSVSKMMPDRVCQEFQLRGLGLGFEAEDLLQKHDVRRQLPQGVPDPMKHPFSAAVLETLVDVVGEYLDSHC